MCSLFRESIDIPGKLLHLFSTLVELSSGKKVACNSSDLRVVMSSRERVLSDNDELQSSRVCKIRSRFERMRRSISESSVLSVDVSPERCQRKENYDDSTLYAKVRQSLHKVNRVSKSSLPPPSTPSKPGVYVETCIGKFAQIKSLFDRRCRGVADRSPRVKPNGARDKVKMANDIIRKFKNNMNFSGQPTRRRLYTSGEHSIFLSAHEHPEK